MIAGIPGNGSTLNNGGYSGVEVPASIVCDAILPLSRTWFDASSAFCPEGAGSADKPIEWRTKFAFYIEGTSVRAAIVAGTTVSSMTQTPGRDADGQRRNGGIHNFPRFQESWSCTAGTSLELRRFVRSALSFD